MKDIYCYPAIFNCTKEGISVVFPDMEGVLHALLIMQKQSKEEIQTVS